MKRHTLIPLLLISTAPLFSYAKPVVQKEAGKPLEIRWENNSVARYYVAKSPIYRGDIPFQVSENTCNSTLPKGCFIRAYYRADIPLMYWQKHPKPEREGKVVLAKFGEQDFLINFPNFILMDHRLMKDPLAKDFPVDEIVCPDFSWLPGVNEKAAPDSYTIARWNVEKMDTNPETGLSENRIIGGAIGVELTRKSDQSLSLTSAKSFFGPLRTLLQQGDILAWILPLSNGEYCQISIKANSTKLGNEASAVYYDLLTNFKVSEPYLWESDHYSKGGFPGFFNYFIANPDSWNPQ